jgi:putative hemolysin
MTEVWVVILILTFIIGVISLTEACIAASKRAKLESFLKKGSRNARFVLENLGRQGAIHHSLQLWVLAFTFAISVASFCLFGLQLDYFSTLGTGLLSSESYSGFSRISIAFLLTVLPVFMLIHFFTQILPGRLGAHKPEPLAVFFSPFARILHRLINPVVWCGSFFSELLFRLIGLPKSNGETQVTEEEVIEIIAQGTSSGTIDEVEQDMLERVLLLGDRSVGSIMTNRIEVEWLDIQESHDQILARITESNHSLFPVCDGELDKVLGIISSKKVLISTRKSQISSLKSLLEPAKVIPENMKALAALEELKASKAKMAVVVDEYGSIQGLLTQSDLFESIIAEHDTPDEENETSIVQRNENSYLVDALLPFEEFMQYFEIEDVAPEDRTGFHSLGGFILHLSKQIPLTGEKYSWKNFEFEVVDMDGNRIDKILLTIQEINEEKP